ncbi:Uncharacterised protein [Serratia fonticola]|jgi:transposase-like protein|uniref:Transposase n=1 Tax=Serratia fonticola TaxID=47917 RepID=A0A3S4X5H1_SERFO|nr:Uncharacterised protein [Serratia fonticola]
MVFVMLLLMSLIRNVFSHLHIAQCVRWYLVYSLRLHNLDEMMAERGIVVDHLTLHRWVDVLECGRGQNGEITADRAGY